MCIRDRAKAEAASERLAAKVERKLVAAGVTDAALARAARMVNLAPDASDDDIAAEVDALKADIPGLFTPAAAGGTPPAPSGVTGSNPPPPGGQGTKTAVQRGRDRWASRKAS